MAHRAGKAKTIGTNEAVAIVPSLKIPRVAVTVQPFAV